MLPYALNQRVEFKKGFGPLLGDLNLDKVLNINESQFTQKIKPVYNAINLVNKNQLTINKNTIGFVGAPWTLLVYMINKRSPKLKLMDNFFDNKILIEQILNILDKFIKLHIKNQIDNGAEIIQIFDSWAGLLKNHQLQNYVYNPTLSLVKYVKSLNIPVICFPRGIKDYKNYCKIIKPDVISIDYDTDPLQISTEIEIPIQGGMDPKVLLTDKVNLKKEATKYLDTFKDHPYIFNLGHGILPETNPDMMDYLVKTVKDY